MKGEPVYSETSAHLVDRAAEGEAHFLIPQSMGMIALANCSNEVVAAAGLARRNEVPELGVRRRCDERPMMTKSHGYRGPCAQDRSRCLQHPVDDGVVETAIRRWAQGVEWARETVVLDQLEGAFVQPVDRCHPRDPLDAQWAEVLGRDFRAEGVYTLQVRPFQVLPLEVRQNWHLVRCTESTHWS